MSRKSGMLLIGIIFSSFLLMAFAFQIIVSPDTEVSMEEFSLSKQETNSYSVQWLQNPTMISPLSPIWSSTSGGADISDTSAIDGTNQANMTVIGDQGSQTILSDPPSTSDWTAFDNPDFPVRPYGNDGPGGNPGDGIDSSGMWASHTWDENGAGGQLGQTPSVEWKRNVTTLVNMSDYQITDASLSAIVNATVDADVDVPGDTAHGGSGGTFSGAVYDYVRFYVTLSTLSESVEFEVAYYKTSTLGAGDPPGTDTLSNTYMIVVPKSQLIYYLSSVLEEGDNHNFTITIGIFIYCEDNCQFYELDTFTLLRINYFNFTYSYVKKIDKTSYMEWSQIGNKLPSTPGKLTVDSARLYFQYKIDTPWPTADSPNSEIRVLINSIKHSETVDLSLANSSWQDAKVGGYDVTSLIKKDVNISVSIQLYLADDFTQPSDITISIDNVYLWINYTIIVQGPTLSVSANKTSLYTNQYTQITVNCENSTANNVSHLIMYNPLTSTNTTLDTNFNGLRTYLQNFTTNSPGAYLFKFWANSTAGYTSYDEIYIVWTAPIPPSLSLTANTTSLFTSQISQITVTCQNGSEQVSALWYFDPLTSNNITLATNFTGQRIFLLNKTSLSAGPYIFKFWANSSLGMGILTEKELTIIWNDPVSPSLTISANVTDPYVNKWTQIKVICQSGSTNVSSLWYYNPLDLNNHTLSTNFDGLQTLYLNFTSSTAGSFVFKFWANATLGPDSYKEILIVWVTPLSPILTITANVTDPYVNQWSQITVNCQSGSANVSTLWYYNPLDTNNHTLATNFAGNQQFNLDFTSSSTGSYKFQFWANSSLGSDAYKEVTIVWVTPQAPTLNVLANITDPYVDYGVMLTVTCQSGSANVSTLWYYNPLDANNHTLATNFAGTQLFYLNFTTSTAGSRQFKFWANSTFNLEVTETVTVIWVTPTSPIITVNANTTNPYINQATQLTVTCQSGSANVSTFWYYNPLDSSNHTLASNFAGSQLFYLNFTAATAGSREFQFWANSTLGSDASETITIVWVLPTAPIITLTTNTTTPYVDQGVQIKVTTQSGTGNISVLWYYNPLDLANHTLGTNFAGSRTDYLNFTSSSAGAFEFKFWANSTLGLETIETITIVWVVPTPPILTVNANTTTPYINEVTQLVVTCQSGIGNVSVLWYNNPFDSNNYTLATNFDGVQTHHLNFTSAIASSYEFRFWANSTLGLETYTAITVIWVVPQPPILTILANTTTPYINQYAQLTLTAQSGTGNISVLWYYNPLDLTNHTLDTNFAGSRNYQINVVSATSGSYLFRFWANSSSGLDAYNFISIVWVNLQAPILTVSANTTTPYITQYAQITVNCQSGSGNVSRLWYYNPFDLNNHTLATDYSGSQTFYLNFTNSAAGSFQFRFWANSSFKLEVTTSLSIVWVTPQAPILALSSNATILEIDQWVQFTLTCQSGSFNVSHLWYYNAIDATNNTLATNFAGSRVFYLNFTSGTANSYQFRFWANSTFNLETYTFITVMWVTPQPPSISITANITNPYTGYATQITVQCQSGSGNVHTFWYNNPLDGQNHTLATDFAGVQGFTIVNVSQTAGSYTYRFWANTSSHLEVSESLLIVWVDPLPPVLSTSYNATNIYPTQWTQIRITCIPGSGNVSLFWYNNPFTNQNITLGANFDTVQTIALNYSSLSPDTFIFRIWANSTFGLLVDKQVTIVWSVPTPPSITINADPLTPFIGQESTITITCQAGTGNVSVLWVYDPIANQNITLAMNFAGERTFTVTLSTETAGTVNIIVWANSTYLAEASQSLPLTWVLPPETGDLTWLVTTLAIVLAAVAAIVAAYQLYFKIPKTVRTIRGVKKAIRSGKPTKPVEVKNRTNTVDEIFQRRMKMKKLPQAKPPAPAEKVLRKPKI
ncbi:MAG: hypothetical protein ACTSRS_08855 [Candidatus Helarchaeota archaeon]